jgi:hypothetical protein
MRRTGSKRWWWRTVLAVLLLDAPGGGPARGDAPASAAAPDLTVAFELLVLDAQGRPVTDVRLEEIEVVQDATRQKIGTFRTGSRPGLYEITYAPLSGRPGGVTARVTRRGTVVRGPDGPVLKPRILAALSPLEAELTRHLAAKAAASDLRCDVAV